MSSDRSELRKTDKSVNRQSEALKRQAEPDCRDREIPPAECQVPCGYQSIEEKSRMIEPKEPKRPETKGGAIRIQLQPKRQRLMDPTSIPSSSPIRDGAKEAANAIKMNLAQKVQESNPVVPVKDESVKAAFGGSDDDSGAEEEIPELVRIRMRNIGKYTPTSEGPRSYGKTRNGFTDTRLRPHQF